MPKALPPAVEAVYLRALRHWRWALATPLLYLLLAEYLRTQRGVGVEGSVSAWDGPYWRAMMIGLAAGSAAGLGAGRVRRRYHLRRYGADPARALRRWMMDFYVMAALADVLAFLGLIDAAAAGRGWSLFAGGALAYLGYLAAYPIRSELAGLDEPELEDEETL